MTGPTTDDLLVMLLHQAGITAAVRQVDPFTDQGITNRMTLVTLEDGQRFVVREYRWPWGETDYSRPRKERFLHDLLRRHGVPVPAILASIDAPNRSAALMEYLPGVPLGDALALLGPPERDQAWRSCGAALWRAHAITYPPESYGVIVGEEVRPFGAVNPPGDWADTGTTWGEFHVTMIMRNFDLLSHRKPDVPMDGEVLRVALAEAARAINPTRPALLHNDTHLWNVLVQPTPGGWACSGWLDWEYAWVGDPDWDLVRMDLFRRRPIGPTPAAFWEGYGRRPTEPGRSIYTLHIQLWMANQYLEGDRNLMPTYEAAMAYVERLDREVAALASVLRSA